MNFYKIRIHSQTKGTIIITPIQFYNIEDHSVKYVIMFNLKFINNNPEIEQIESNIPYYISNGDTNKLRANMLYPFMCYSSIDQADICPYDESRIRKGSPYTGVLIKYNINHNINIEKLEDELLNTFLGIYPDLDIESSKLRAKIDNVYERRYELISVLGRLQNMVDFIICIVNDVISHFNYKLEQADIDNGKYRPLSLEQRKLSVDYTDISIFGKETSYTLSPFNADDSSSSFNNHFRSVILTILNRYYKLFVDNHIIDIEKITLYPETITVSTFNSIVSICNKEIAKSKINNYKFISKKIIDIIIEKIDIISEEHQLMLKSLIKQSKKADVINDELYNKLLKKWNVQCLSHKITINNKNVHSMNIEEICHELSSYTELLQHNAPELIQELSENCYGESSVKNSDLLVKIMRNTLLNIRSKIILYYYNGQLEITFKTQDNTEKTINIDIDSSETIFTLKSKIFIKEGITPSRQHLMIKEPYSTIVHLEDSKTIASYKILNNSKLSLVIKYE
jgi:large subunit ribosomal protein L40e